MDQVNHLMVSVLQVYMYFEIGSVICPENAAFKITLEIGDSLLFFDCQYSIDDVMYFPNNTGMFCAEQKV